jgi:hypothetical protein
MPPIYVIYITLKEVNVKKDQLPTAAATAASAAAGEAPTGKTG